MSSFSNLFGRGDKPEAEFIRTQRQPNGNTYDVYRAPSRSQALAFLRGLEIKEERRYAVVETPEGNVGKDFILIFDEKTQEIIELGQRKALPQPKKSAGRCYACGYPVIPVGEVPDFGPAVGAVIPYFVISEAKKKGAGYACVSCGAICCAFCGPPDRSPFCAFCRGQMHSFQERKREGVRDRRANGASPMSSTFPPNGQALLDATQEGDIRTVQDLLARGVNVNVYDDAGYTALHIAIRRKNIALVVFLLKHGADANAKAKMRGSIRGETPLYLATLDIHEYVNIIPLLVRAGADLNSPDPDDNLPLHLVVKEGIPKLIECLIDHGANVNARNSLGNTPLHIACHPATWCKPEVIEMLITKGVHVDSQMFDELICLASQKVERNHRQEILRALQKHKNRLIQPAEHDRIRFRCPYCSSQLNSPRSACGRRGKCPKCSNAIRIPQVPSQVPSDTSSQTVEIDGNETRSWQVLANIPCDQAVARFPDYDVAYLRAAYPSGNCGDHASASVSLLEEGLGRCIRKSWLMGRLSAYWAWKGEALKAFDYAVKSILSTRTINDSPGDLIGSVNLLTEVFRATGHTDVAEKLRRLNPGYDEPEQMKQKIALVANHISGRYDKGFVSGAADMLRAKQL